MREMILNHLINRSDQTHFRYALICPSCSQEWSSTQIAIQGTADPEAHKMLAAEEAETCFHVCPLCGRLVCSSCMTAVGEMRMCKNCADRMG